MQTTRHSGGNEKDLLINSFDMHGSAEAEPQPGVIDQAPAADVRIQAVQRMRKMNVSHAQHAWQHRHGDRLCPHGLAFLYTHPHPTRPRRWVLSAATKLWLDEPQARDLPRLLYTFGNIVAEQCASPGWDVRTAHANRVDQAITAQAVFCGVAVSSLDTYSGSWEQVRDSASGPANIPGRIVIVLTDETTIVAERRGLDEYNALQLHATHTLELAWGHSIYPWSAVTSQALREDAAYADILRWLDTLNDTLWRADNARIVAAHTATHTGVSPARPGRRSTHGR